MNPNLLRISAILSLFVSTLLLVAGCESSFHTNNPDTATGSDSSSDSSSVQGPYSSVKTVISTKLVYTAKCGEAPVAVPSGTKIQVQSGFYITKSSSTQVWLKQVTIAGSSVVSEKGQVAIAIELNDPSELADVSDVDAIFWNFSFRLDGQTEDSTFSIGGNTGVQVTVQTSSTTITLGMISDQPLNILAVPPGGGSCGTGNPDDHPTGGTQGTSPDLKYWKELSVTCASVGPLAAGAHAQTKIWVQSEKKNDVKGSYTTFYVQTERAKSFNRIVIAPSGAGVSQSVFLAYDADHDIFKPGDKMPEFGIYNLYDRNHPGAGSRLKDADYRPGHVPLSSFAIDYAHTSADWFFKDARPTQVYHYPASGSYDLYLQYVVLKGTGIGLDIASGAYCKATLTIGANGVVL